MCASAICTIKGQEILTADKVAIRVSIIVQFRVTDPVAALHAVANYEDRLYTDVQLAARRSLAATTLEDILTNRNRLSEDILRDVKESAERLWRGHSARRREGSGLPRQPPGDHRTGCSAAERNSQAQLVEARTKAEVQRLDAQARAEVKRLEVAAQAEAQQLEATAQAEAQQIKATADVHELRAREQAATAYSGSPGAATAPGARNA